jgi:hypothetical protein
VIEPDYILRKLTEDVACNDNEQDGHDGGDCAAPDINDKSLTNIVQDPMLLTERTDEQNFGEASTTNKMITMNKAPSPSASTDSKRSRDRGIWRGSPPPKPAASNRKSEMSKASSLIRDSLSLVTPVEYQSPRLFMHRATTFEQDALELRSYLTRGHQKQDDDTTSLSTWWMSCMNLDDVTRRLAARTSPGNHGNVSV